MRELEWHDLQWSLRRTPSPVLEMMKRHGQKLIAAGGYVRDCICGDRINDVDLFTSSKELAEVFAKEFAGDAKIVETENAFTIPYKFKYAVQLIHRWTYEKPEQVVASFDFTVACASFWYDLEKKKWCSLCHDRFYSDLAAKRLRYLSPIRDEDAGGSMLRVLKFYQRGYRIPLDSMGAVIARLAMAVRWNEIGDEKQAAKVITGLFREVDPNVDPGHIAHLPTEDEDEEVVTEPPDGLQGVV